MISTKTRIARSLGISKKKTVFLRSDFESFGSPTRVTRALQELITEGRIVRAGRGIYVKARRSSVTGNAVPLESLETIAYKALSALGVDPQPGSADRAYVGGLTQDIPMEISIDVGSSRISRRIELGGREVSFERNRRPAA
jgi:DNA-binding GntR family transcriptional regulator